MYMGLSVDIYNKEIMQNKYIVQIVTINCILKKKSQKPNKFIFSSQLYYLRFRPHIINFFWAFHFVRSFKYPDCCIIISNFKNRFNNNYERNRTDYTEKDKQKQRRKNWKTHYREKSYFPSACAFYQFVCLIPTTILWDLVNYWIIYYHEI